MEHLTTPMVGRENEQAVLAAFLTAPHGRALVLKGETGVGKSALLEDTARQAAASGYRVVRAVGVEAESQLPYSGLHQLLHPLLPQAEALDVAHRTAIDVVFGRSRETPPSVMTLGIALLDLVAVAAERERLLLVLDDGQWLDAASTEVCGFVGRRLAGTTAKLLAALRPESSAGFDAAALPVLPVPPLDGAAAERLLDGRHPAVDPRVRRQVLDQARGNPLALLELPSYLGGLTEGEPGAGQVAVPLPDRFRQVYGARIAGLGAAVRAELLRGALDGVNAVAVSGGGAFGGTTGGGTTGGGTTGGGTEGAEAPVGASRGAVPAGRVGPAVRYRMRDVEEAAAAGLLDQDPVSGEFAFRHPLVRSTVVRLATPNERRAAHAELARVHRDEVERRATHLAAAAVDPDEEVAVALEEAAASATRRGGAAAAVTWLTRAAELSPVAADRARRLADAAFVAGHAGLLHQAQLLAGAERVSGAAGTTASALAFAYAVLYEDGDVRSAHRQLLAAAERAGAAGPSAELTRVVNLLLGVSQYVGDAGYWERTHRLLDGLGDLVPVSSRIYRDAWSDVVRRGTGVAERVAAAYADYPDLDPWDITRLGVAAYHLDHLSHYRTYLLRSVERELRTGAVANGMTMLHLIMLDRMASGEWEAAERTGQQVLELTLAHGNVLFAQQSRAYLAQLAALRGETERARELQAVVDRWARPRRVGFLVQITEAAATTAALSEGDYEAAYRCAIGITAPGAFEPCAHQAPRTLLDLVEAALHTGRDEEARRHAVAAREAGLPQVSPRLAVTTYGALAMTAADLDEAGAMYRRAEAHPAAGDFPFELARIRLAHGIHLRRHVGPRAARPVLTAAAETLGRLGARAWAERARAELRTCGAPAAVSAAVTGAPDPSALTWQERRIADLAATGLTNKEIGERTHLSPRTVSSHLYRVFPKLGITSRAALRDALAALPADLP